MADEPSFQLIETKLFDQRTLGLSICSAASPPLVKGLRKSRAEIIRAIFLIQQFDICKATLQFAPMRAVPFKGQAVDWRSPGVCSISASRWGSWYIRACRWRWFAFLNCQTTILHLK